MCIYIYFLNYTHNIYINFKPQKLTERWRERNSIKLSDTCMPWHRHPYNRNDLKAITINNTRLLKDKNVRCKKSLE